MAGRSEEAIAVLRDAITIFRETRDRARTAQHQNGEDIPAGG